MRKSISTLLLVAVLSVTTMYSPKADALVGMVFKNKIIKTIGGIGALGGGAVAGTSLVVGAGSSWGALVAFVYGSAFGIIGLVILDDNTLADIEFRAIDESNPEAYQGFTLAEAQTYNNELELLNTIRQTIISEVSDNDSTEEAEQLWLEYSEALSPATFEIAQEKAKVFLQAL